LDASIFHGLLRSLCHGITPREAADETKQHPKANDHSGMVLGAGLLPHSGEPKAAYGWR